MRASLAQPLVEAVDQIRHLLEPLGDAADADLPEVFRLDRERLPQLFDHVVRGHRAVAVDQVVQVAGGETGLVRERAVGDVLLGHQPLNRRPERLIAEAALARHYRSSTLTRRSSPVARSRMSTAPASRLFLPAGTRTGQPIRSASANFSPARWSRSSRRTTRPRASIAAAARSAISSAPGSATTWTSYGAIASGHAMPCSSWCCSTAAAMTRPGPIPYEPVIRGRCLPSSSRNVAPKASE